MGTDDGRLHVTRDGGKTWTSVEKNVPGVPANTWIPNDPPSQVRRRLRLRGLRQPPAGGLHALRLPHRRLGQDLEEPGDHGPARLRPRRSSRTRSTATSSSSAPSSASGSRSTAAGAGCPGRHGVPTALGDGSRHPSAGPRPGDRHPRPRASTCWTTSGRCATLSEKTLAEPLHLYEIADAQAALGRGRARRLRPRLRRVPGREPALRRAPHLLAERARPAPPGRGEGARAQGGRAGGPAQGRGGG